MNDTDRGVKCLKKSISLCSRTENIELVCQYVSPGEALSILHEFKRNSSRITRSPQDRPIFNVRTTTFHQMTIHFNPFT